MLWLIEVRKHAAFFAITIGLAIVTSVAAALFPQQQVLEVIRTLTGMLVWCASAVYVAADLARFLALGNDVLLHCSAFSPLRNACVKATILGIFLVALHAATLGGGAEAIAEAVGSDAPTVFAYYVLAKALSIVTYLATVVLCALVSKVFRTRNLVVTTFTVALVAMVIGQTIALWRLGAPETDFFFIGVGGDFLSVNLYANILPIILTAPSEGFVPPIAGLSIVLNMAVAAATLLGVLLLSRFRRFDFVAL